jgi:hypothetical protein
MITAIIVIEVVIIIGLIIWVGVLTHMNDQLQGYIDRVKRADRREKSKMASQETTGFYSDTTPYDNESRN